MDSKTVARWLAITTTILTFGAGAAMADGAVITGTVTYRERIMLPETAVVEVQLLDVSRADAAATVLGETIAEGASPPYRFSIAYDPDDIVAGHSYAVSARISDGEKLLFISTSRHAVFGDGPDATDIVVQSAGDAPAAVAQPTLGTPTGNWLAEDIDGGGVIDDLQSGLNIAADGAVSGTGGCNRIGGQAVIEGDKIAFGSMFSTNMACAPAAMDQEGKFLNALGRVTSFRLDEARGKLVLVDASGADIVTLAQHHAEL